MAMPGDGRAPYEIGGGTEEKLRLNEEPQNVSQEAGRNYLSGESEVNTHQGGNPASVGISELEQKLKHMTLTRFEASTSGSLKQMASPPHPTTMENLPDELLLNIFIRLMAKQLAQMRFVSKSWNSLLSHSSFIRSHLSRSIQINDQILLVFYQDKCSCDSKPFTAHPSRSPHLELTEFNKLPPVNPETGSSENIRVIGAVNGLICSSYGDSVVHIWNPSLSAVLTLPPCPMPSRHSYEINLRFGYDPKNDDYKVLKILSEDDFDYKALKIINERRQVEVFSMRKGSWEDITLWFPSHIRRISGHEGVCADGHDGHLHWYGHYVSHKAYTLTIVAFDLGSHTFSEIPFPDSMRDHPTETENLLGVLARKLCVMAWHDNDVCDVWVMEEYGVAESWVKRHVFSQFGGDKFQFGFTSHNEFLFEDDVFLEDNDQHLVLYDPIANKTKKFEKFSCSESHHPRTIVEYMDSLVWMARAKYEMVDGGGQN